MSERRGLYVKGNKRKALAIKHIAILGSTGSIGTQALEVVQAHPGAFRIHALTAHSNAAKLIDQALLHQPAYVVVTDESAYRIVKSALDSHPHIAVLQGLAAIEEVVAHDEVDMVLTALVGAVGLSPTIAAIKANKDIALANKETLVVGGDLVMGLVAKHGVKLLPVDSEHSAIFQCLEGESADTVEKLILTASGGPFRRRDKTFLEQVTIEQALAHPNWVMGAKITIDSASLMNKGLEVIEAKWLFGLESRQIDVLVHPQSIIHSMVQFNDSSVKAQMGLPNMKMPIQHALLYPYRVKNELERLDFMQYPSLSFEQPDMEVFQNLALAYQALEEGGSMPCVLNAANEIAVAAFLNGQIGFLKMSDVIAATMARVPRVAQPSLADYLDVDNESRRIASELLPKATQNK